jgi:competence protein ComEA
MRNILGAIALSVLTTAAPAFAATPPHPGQAAAAAPGRSATPAVPGESRPGGAVINLNEASEAQLILLPGVGPSRATAIVNYRRQHPFKHVEELQRIRGIGRKTFARLRPLLALSGPTTLTARPGRN